MRQLFFDYQSDPVLGENFESRWVRVCEGQKSKDISGSINPEAVTILKEFLNKYYQDFSSKASANPSPETKQEKAHIRRITKSLEFYSNWLARITREMKKWPEERWAANLKALQELNNSGVVINAQAKARTYMRILNAQKDESAERLSGFDVVFFELRTFLRNLADDIYDTENAIE